MVFVELRLKINAEIIGIIMEGKHLQLLIPDQLDIKVKSH